MTASGADAARDGHDDEGSTHFNVLVTGTPLGREVLGLVRGLIDRTPSDPPETGPVPSPVASPAV